jgi:alkanesulfonate monooxygenase SsuD/methylene tetrahydromethanopterin reductase-like flavin-dependent oxidoreductase (luciferase family)
MGIVKSVRGVLWAPKRQPEQVAYLASLAHERFTPPELIEQAKAAEAAGFDGICCSDHLAPWWAPIAGRLSDGVWTLADPQTAPGVIAGYRHSCEEAEREPGETAS